MPTCWPPSAGIQPGPGAGAVRRRAVAAAGRRAGAVAAAPQPGAARPLAGLLGAAPHWRSTWRATPRRWTGCWPRTGTRPAGRCAAAGRCPPPGGGDGRRPPDVARRNSRSTPRRWKGAIDADNAGDCGADLADAAIAALLPRISPIRRALRPGAGRRAGGAGDGQAGQPGDAAGLRPRPGAALRPSAGGDRQSRAAAVAAGGYVLRAAQLVAAITAPGRGGQLYEVDMRLRPSGNKGPVAVSLSAFERYIRPRAWTWERMALTRALRRRPPGAAAAAPSGHRRGDRRRGDTARARADAVATRRGWLRDLPAEGPWDLKCAPAASWRWN